MTPPTTAQDRVADMSADGTEPGASQSTCVCGHQASEHRVDITVGQAPMNVCDGSVLCGCKGFIETRASVYTCPGIAMPQPPDAPWEGYVACYRAGHHCPPKVGITTEDETHRTTTYRCPCCGERGSVFCTPKEWSVDTDALVRTLDDA